MNPLPDASLLAKEDALHRRGLIGLVPSAHCAAAAAEIQLAAGEIHPVDRGLPPQMPGADVRYAEQPLAADAFNVFHAIATGPCCHLPLSSFKLLLPTDRTGAFILLIVHNGCIRP